MVVVYLAYTYQATEWRIAIRRRMNDSDTDANTKAVDSLLNYETVKYFGAERREAARYDESMAKYEKASTQTYVSLAVLNAGQAVIFTRPAFVLGPSFVRARPIRLLTGAPELPGRRLRPRPRVRAGGGR